MMKQFILSIVLLIVTTALWAQAPQQFKFQAVARDASGAPYVATNLGIRVSIVRNGASGLIDFSERHNVLSSPLGVFDLAIGNGAPINGTMASLDWGNHAYYLKIDIDPNGGTDYIDLGSSQLLSVPYAIYANESGSGGSGSDSQTISYNPDTHELSISNGNTVTLPEGGQGEQGTQGIMGEQGEQGATGEQGIQGEAGIMGTQGIQGEQGVPGTTGAIGEQGIQGEQGIAGTGISLLGNVATIADLPAGANNGDLYIVQTDGNGYAWDGSMWNNVGAIQGPQGEIGPQGETGATGEQGIQGEVGTAGETGTAGVQGIQGVPGTAGAMGVQGTQGEQGIAGTGISLLGNVATVGDLPAGANNGDLYIVQADGNGYAWDGSMWNNVGPIQGPQGEMGAVGSEGAQGEQGVPGPMGAIGEQGIPGETGLAGEVGSQGEQGEIGPVGFQGEQGEMGLSGPQGEQGIPGVIGATGATGAMGPQGEPGTSGSYTAGDGINIIGDQISANDTSPTNEIQTLELIGTDLSLNNGGGTVDLANLPTELTLPYFDEADETGQSLFHIHNTADDFSSTAIKGTLGVIPEDFLYLPAAVVGMANDAGLGADGVLGISNSPGYSGVVGEANGTLAHGVSGHANEVTAIGGYFRGYDENSAALVTETGRVGFGTNTPASKVEILDYDQTRFSLNGDYSDGVSSIFFREDLEVSETQSLHSGWLWEAKLNGGLTVNSSMSLYDYSYLAGSTDEEDEYRTEVYSLQAHADFLALSTYTHSWNGQGRFENNDEDIPVLDIKNDMGPGLYIEANSLQNKPHIDLKQTDTGYARMNFTNTTSSSQWQIGARGSDGADQVEGVSDSKMFFRFTNDSASRSIMTITASQKMGIGNFSPDESLVIGSNLGRNWGIPAATIGNDIGGGLTLGTPDITLDFECSTLLGAQITSSDDNGVGQGKIKISTRQLTLGVSNIGIPNPRTYPLRVIQNTSASGGDYGLNLINGADPDKNWEIRVLNDAYLGLFMNNSYRGVFNATNGNYSPTSDARLKTNIQTLENVLPLLQQLEAKRYEYKSNRGEFYNGFLAQDIQPLFPEIVTEVKAENDGEEDTLLVDYSQLAVLAIAAVNELSEQVDEQASEIETLKAEHQADMEAMNARLEALETLLLKD